MCSQLGQGLLRGRCPGLQSWLYVVGSSGAARAGRFLAQNAVVCLKILWEIRIKYSNWFPWVWDRVPPRFGCDVLDTCLSLMLELNALWELLLNNLNQLLFLPSPQELKVWFAIWVYILRLLWEVPQEISWISNKFQELLFAHMSACWRYKLKILGLQNIYLERRDAEGKLLLVHRDLLGQLSHNLENYFSRVRNDTEITDKQGRSDGAALSCCLQKCEI